MQKEIDNNTNGSLVSAIITTYNRLETAKRAIVSVLNQSYNNLEIIVVEDGSNSGINSWINKEEHSSIIYCCHRKNKGLAAARNTGLRLAKGDYIAYLDDDDEWKPQRIEKQMQLLSTLSEEEKNKLGVIYCGSETHYLNQNDISFAYPKNSGNLKEAIIREGATTLSSVFLFSKKALCDIGGFDENLPSSIDHDIWMSLAKGNYYAYTINESLVITYNRINRRTMMTNTNNRIKGVRMYVEKWMPTYQEWFGKREGTIHGERYFAKVIASLVSVKIAEGNYSEALIASKSIFQFSKQKIYNIAILSRKLLQILLKKIMPVKYYKYLIKLKMSKKIN